MRTVLIATLAAVAFLFTIGSDAFAANDCDQLLASSRAQLPSFSNAPAGLKPFVGVWRGSWSDGRGGACSTIAVGTIAGAPKALYIIGSPVGWNIASSAKLFDLKVNGTRLEMVTDTGFAYAEYTRAKDGHLDGLFRGQTPGTFVLLEGPQ